MGNKTKAPVLANRYITVSRQVEGEGGKKETETANIVPGQEVPDWAVEYIKPEHLGDPRDLLVEADQFLDALRETARREGIQFTEEWTKEHLSQAITAVRQAALTHTPLDMSQFGPMGAAAPAEPAQESDSGALKPLDQMSRDELDAEHVQRFGKKPHHALTDGNLRNQLAEAREGG